jgi:serine/threonine-protein kinase
MSDVQIGSVLKQRYRIDAKLGEGGMAVVYRAFDQSRRVSVALKLLKADYAEDRDFIRRFKREAENLKHLQHPHIVRFYELEEDGVLAFMVLDYINGPTLRRIMRQRGEPHAPGEVLGYLRPICAALSYAHSERVVHCDMKPANVMVDHTGRVFLNDFGIARLSESATVTFSTPGTAAYMAPEQWRGDDVAPATDVYALGIVLYELLTGRQPFTGDTIQTRGHTREKLMREHFGLAPPLASELNPQLPRMFDPVLAHCLGKESADRFQSADGLLNAFEAACRQAVITEVPVPQPAQGLQQTDPGVLTIPASASSPLPLPPISQPVQARNVAVGLPTRNPGLLVAGAGAIAVVLLVGLLAFGGGGLSVASLLATATATATASFTAPPSPTKTPAPSATPSPPPTSTVAPTATPCPFGVAGRFTALWLRYPAELGCPATESPRFIQDAEQLFQNGHMFWRGDTDVYYVVYESGPSAGLWEQYPSKYNVDGLAKCAETAPSGLVKPIRGFGNVWCGLGGASANIGWARDREVGFSAAQGIVQVQDFQQGIIFQDSDGSTRNLTYVLFNTGSFVRVDPRFPPTPAAIPAGPLAILPIDLALIGNQRFAQNYLNPPQGLVTLQGIPFEFGERVFWSQADPTVSLPTSAQLPLSIPSPRSAFILVATGDGFRRFEGKAVGRIEFYFQINPPLIVELVLGKNVREWQTGSSSIVTRAPEVSQVWQGTVTSSPDIDAVLDLLTISIPPTNWADTMTGIGIYDTSVESVQSRDPAIGIMGLAIEHVQP